MAAHCAECIHWRSALEDALALPELDRGICRRRLLLDALRCGSDTCSDGLTAAEAEELRRGTGGVAMFIPARDDRTPFARVPVALLSRPGLTDGAKLLYGLLARYAGMNGECHPSQERLAHDLGKSTRQVRRLIDELQSAGLILATLPAHGERARGQAAEYTFLPPQTPDTHDRCTPDIGVPCTPDIHDHEHRTCVTTDTGHGCPPNRFKKKEKRKDTHTEGSHENYQALLSSHSGLRVCVPSALLSEEQEECISLTMERYQADGKLQNPGAMRSTLTEKARRGELDLSELEDLRAWKREEAARVEEEKRAFAFRRADDIMRGHLQDGEGRIRESHELHALYLDGGMDAAVEREHAELRPLVREELARLLDVRDTAVVIPEVLGPEAPAQYRRTSDRKSKFLRAFMDREERRADEAMPKASPSLALDLNLSMGRIIGPLQQARLTDKDIAAKYLAGELDAAMDAEGIPRSMREVAVMAFCPGAAAASQEVSK